MNRWVLLGLVLQLVSALVVAQNAGKAQTAPVFGSNRTYTYKELIDGYKKLDASSDQMRLLEYGSSDAGLPLHLLVINKNKNFTPDKAKNHTTLLIMNGIHPGESEGIDASLLLAQDLASGKIPMPQNLTICIMPVYNIEGMLNRKKFTRANQDGPLEKGFRGNGQNYDLNRDFIKADTKNTFAFYQIYHTWNPDVFLDNHTSNGADYQYTMTLITTQEQKLGGETAELLHKKMKPWLYEDMKRKNREMVPYVHIYGKAPDEAGYEEFIETPKYSTGYTALFGTLGFVAETHMLKPYPQRVMATYDLMRSIIAYSDQNAAEIHETRQKDLASYKTLRHYQSNYQVDKTRSFPLLFKGFEAEKIKSSIGSYERTYYNRNKPFEKTINYYNYCKPAVDVELPRAYVIPQAWGRALERLKASGVQMNRFERDTQITVNATYISSFESLAQAYEGHHVNHHVSFQHKVMPVKFAKGDYLVLMNQTSNRYIAEVLEAQTEDGFFAWNFFDPILNQKEGFSDYVFEDDAIQLLKEDSVLNRNFEEWKTANPDKLKSSYEVLNFIFTHSAWYEAEHKRLPVYRIE